MSAIVISAILSFILGLLVRVGYDAITRRKQRTWAARSFISRLDLLITSLRAFESYYIDTTVPTLLLGIAVSE